MGKKIREWAFMTLGVCFVIVGVYFFKFPNNFAIGGVTGLAMILAPVTGFSSSTIVLAINIILLVVGLIVIGKEFSIKTVYGSLLLSFGLKLMEEIFPMTGPLTDEPVLELAFAIGFPAVGAALLFNNGGSTGGTDVVAMILKKYTSINIGQSLLISDFILTLFAFPAFGVQTGLLSMLGLILKSSVVDSVIESLNLCKYLTIICEDPDPIEDYIVKKLRRGATVYKATGAFTGGEKTVILTVMNRAQAIHLRQFIKENEPEAFILVTNTSEIIGRGFRGM
ncbi:MAG: YitT family protein [Lachnospiraceae bacterium]|nr:YitT family protein [Lachnospiraceae bacterium]